MWHSQWHHIFNLSQKGGHTCPGSRYNFKSETEDHLIQPVSFWTQREKREHGSAIWLFWKKIVEVSKIGIVTRIEIACSVDIYPFQAEDGPNMTENSLILRKRQRRICHPQMIFQTQKKKKRKSNLKHKIWKRYLRHQPRWLIRKKEGLAAGRYLCWEQKKGQTSPEKVLIVVAERNRETSTAPSNFWTDSWRWRSQLRHIYLIWGRKRDKHHLEPCLLWWQRKSEKHKAVEGRFEQIFERNCLQREDIYLT